MQAAQEDKSRLDFRHIQLEILNRVRRLNSGTFLLPQPMLELRRLQTMPPIAARRHCQQQEPPALSRVLCRESLHLVAEAYQNRRQKTVVLLLRHCIVPELFMGFLADFSMLQHVPCRHKLLGKAQLAIDRSGAWASAMNRRLNEDLIFLANDPAESHQAELLCLYWASACTAVRTSPRYLQRTHGNCICSGQGAVFARRSRRYSFVG